MSGPLTLSAKLGAIGASLLLTALVSIGLTLWETFVERIDDLSARVAVASDDELGALSAGFNRVAET